MPPSGPNQVWQLDFSEFETWHGAVWRIAGCSDYWSKLEFGWHLAAVAEELQRVLAESEPLKAKALLRLLIAELKVNGRSEILPTYRVVTRAVCACTRSAFFVLRKRHRPGRGTERSQLNHLPLAIRLPSAEREEWERILCGLGSRDVRFMRAYAGLVRF